MTCACGGAYYASGKCKQCYQRDYRKANRDKQRKYLREWQRAHTDKVRVYKARWKAKYPERFKAGNDRCNRLWHLAHYGDERYVARKRQWIAANRDKTRFYALKRYHIVRTACGDWTEDEIAAIYERQHGRCNSGDGCGEKFPRRSLAIDHIVPVSKGGCNYAFNLQLLCFSCNSRKNNRITTPIVSLFDQVTT